ncbi:TIGR03621 family F420-dependent LLM class oxidoreductase [Amycolatopsis arida]|uniref:TIGR03621 family F420-dependent LLM class oxidoreductase n=1 Tax=Amycolatopsis arida TaxID=587909 RepID=UPI003CC83882
MSMWSVGGRDEWTAKCRRAEELGYDSITVPDHLGTAPAPFPALAAAAAVTERVHLGPLVLNVPFYTPALLARDIADTVRLAGGRFELGLGAGHMKAEFDGAGLPWRPLPHRVDQLARALDELPRLLAESAVPTPPLLVAGNSNAVLTLAAEHADIVGFAGLRQVPGRPPGTFDVAGADALAERVGFVRARTARDPEFNFLVQHVAITDDPAAELRRWAAPAPYLDPDTLADAPQLLVGRIEQDLVDRVVELRRRFGFSYLTVFEPAMETFAPVVRALRGR